MINYTIGEKEFEFDPRLRATEALKKQFGKDFGRLIEDLDKMTIPKLIQFIYCVMKDPEMTQQEFTDWCYDNLGKGDIDEAVNWLVIQLNYPGISEEDFIKKIQDRNAQADQIHSKTP